MAVTLNRFESLFAAHRNAAIPDLWPWQKEILIAYEGVAEDAGIELPTGTGKTLLGLLVGEDFRQATGRPVAYLAGNKQLAQQVERQARELNFPVVRFQGPKTGWEKSDVRTYNFGQAIGVMNYWNYINAKPGVEAAGMLIFDDVHLLEGPLREFFTVEIAPTDPTYSKILRTIVQRCPYYSLADDLLNDVSPPRPPEMLVFPDSADLADEVRDLLDGHLDEGTDAWWAWQQIRHRLEACCWLVSTRGITFTPYIPPAQTIRHFSAPARRLYMSATLGSADDLQRRIGAPPFKKLTAAVQPRQGERLVIVRNDVARLDTPELVDAVKPLLTNHPKALWLCARRETALDLMATLTISGLPGTVRRLEGDNGEDEPFAAETVGHLVTAGRYDGMDFPDDACRIEVVPEVPVATSDLEAFVSAYLRDAGFADARFAQRVAQALGRCNRSRDDRAVYLLMDTEFVARFSERRGLDALPDMVRSDVFAALERSDGGFRACLATAEEFLSKGLLPASPAPPPRIASTEPPATARREVEGFLALWLEDYGKAASVFDEVAVQLSSTSEHRAFWLAFRALALQLASRLDPAAAAQVKVALRAAATAGAKSTFFTRLWMADARVAGESSIAADATSLHDDIFAAWDELITRYGATGPTFDRWSAALLADVGSTDHDTVVRGIDQLGKTVLGLDSRSPQPTAGEADVEWQLPLPHRILAFEVKMAPEAKRVVNRDVDQAEGAVTALHQQQSRPTRGLLVTPWGEADPTALARLDRVRLVQQTLLVEQATKLLDLLKEYRRGWTEDAKVRLQRRAGVEGQLPDPDWLWRASEASAAWVGGENLLRAWRERKTDAVATR